MPPTRAKQAVVAAARDRNSSSPVFGLNQYRHNGGGEQVGHGSGQHGAETQPGQVILARGGQRADAANLYADGTQVGKAAQRISGNGEGARINLRFQLS